MSVVVCKSVASAEVVTGPGVGVGEEVGDDWALPHTTISGVVLEVEPSVEAVRPAHAGPGLGVEACGTVSHAGVIGSLAIVAKGALLHAIPCGVISKQGLGTEVCASFADGIPELVPSAFLLALRCEDVPEGKVGQGRASQYARLGYILREVVHVIHLRARLLATPHLAVRVLEVVQIFCLRAKRHA